MMNRRAFIGTLAYGLVAAPLAAEAQREAKVARVGILTSSSSGYLNPSSILAHLNALGYVGVLEGLVTGGNPKIITDAAAQTRLPAMYPRRWFVDSFDHAGLMSYEPDAQDLSRRVASYIDRILKGARPADLPVEPPTQYEFVINLKTAKA